MAQLLEKSMRKRLEFIDKELHVLLDALQPKEARISPQEIRELLASKVKEDFDTTKLIRSMRNKEYDV